jgi:hypothetical protein
VSCLAREDLTCGLHASNKAQVCVAAVCCSWWKGIGGCTCTNGLEQWWLGGTLFFSCMVQITLDHGGQNVCFAGCKWKGRDVEVSFMS